MTRVAHIRSSAGFYGAERVLMNLLKVMPGLNIDASLVCIENYISGNTDLVDAAQAENISVFELPCRGKWRFGSQRRLGRYVRGAGHRMHSQS